jgi:hypothetical protein
MGTGLRVLIPNTPSRPLLCELTVLNELVHLELNMDFIPCQPLFI